MIWSLFNNDKKFEVLSMSVCLSASYQLVLPLKLLAQHTLWEKGWVIKINFTDQATTQSNSKNQGLKLDTVQYKNSKDRH